MNAPDDIPTPTLIESEAALRAACERWLEAEAIGIDTEFVRERTYYPLPGLIQVIDGDRVELVDLVAIEDAGAIGRVLTAASPLKIMHAFGEDLEVLALTAGAEPAPLFDTQLAAAFAGLGSQLGYRALVAALLGVELDKGETRSDWRKRPLTPAQLRYAALDVAYLPPMHATLTATLERLGRLQWLEEEIGHVRAARERDRPPEAAYLRVTQHARLDAPDHALLRALAAWREREAMRRNLPKRHVIEDAALIDVALHRPQSVEALAKLPGIGRRGVERHGRKLLELAADAGNREVTPADAPLDLAPYARTLRELRHIVKRAARSHDLPPELVGNRRLLEALLRGVLEKGEAGVPAEFLGWRKAVVTEALLECIGSRQ